MSIPETTSAEAFERYVGGKCLVVGQGEAWRDIKAWIVALPPVVDTLYLPSVSEPFLAWTMSGEIDFQERENEQPMGHSPDQVDVRRPRRARHEVAVRHHLLQPHAHELAPGNRDFGADRRVLIGLTLIGQSVTFARIGSEAAPPRCPPNL